MLPMKIKPYFTVKNEQSDGDNMTVEGELICCDSHEFEVSIVGELKNRLFSTPCLLPQNDSLAIEVKCKKCGKVYKNFVDFETA